MPRVGSLLASVAFLSAAISKQAVCHGECEQQQRQQPAYATELAPGAGVSGTQVPPKRGGPGQP